jgi:hypothetical protein
MGQGCSCADSNDKEQEVRTDPVSRKLILDISNVIYRSSSRLQATSKDQLLLRSLLRGDLAAPWPEAQTLLATVMRNLITIMS